MEFEPDQEALMKCVLQAEGLAERTRVRILRVDIEDSVPIHTNNTSKVVKAKVEYAVVADENKMAAGETEVTAGDTKVTTGDTKLTAGDTKVMASETLVTAGDTKVTAGETKLTANETQVTVSETKVTTDDTKMTASETKGTAGETKVMGDDTKVTAGDTKVTAGDTKLTAGEAKLTANETKVTADDTKVTASETKLTAGETEVAAGETKVAPSKTKVTVSDTKVMASEIKVTAVETKVAGGETEVMASDTKVTASDTKVMANETKVTAGETKMAGSETKVVGGETKVVAGETTVMAADETKVAASDTEVTAGQTKMAALAIKVPFLRTESVYENFKGLRFFDKEAHFYRSVVPRLRALLGAEVAPTLLALDERQVLFMEDLSARGYRVQVDGRLDAEHSAVVLRHLARMHAASHVLRRREAHRVDELIARQFLYGDDFTGRLYVEARPLLVALARTRCLSPETVAKVDAAVERARGDIAAAMDAGRFDFGVLNHGDLKAHNILFEHDDQGRPVQCRFIDFQVCHWSSPALDIVFFAILSVERKVVANNFDSLLQSYVSTLNSTLEQLNCDVRLTEAQLKRDMDSVMAFKISSFLFRTVIDIREFCEDFEYAKIEEASPELIDKLAQSIEIQDSVRFWLEEFDKSGFL